MTQPLTEPRNPWRTRLIIMLYDRGFTIREIYQRMKMNSTGHPYWFIRRWGEWARTTPIIRSRKGLTLNDPLR